MHAWSAIINDDKVPTEPMPRPSTGSQVGDCGRDRERVYIGQHVKAFHS
jgi:hypothetical protein